MNYFEAIKEYKIELKVVVSDGDEDEPDGYIIGWRGFPCETGGHWSYGETLEECINNVISSINN